MSDLLPCPFCGGKPVQRRSYDEDMKPRLSIECSGCLATTGFLYGDNDPDNWADVRAAWNRRALAAAAPPPDRNVGGQGGRTADPPATQRHSEVADPKAFGPWAKEKP